MSIAIRTRGDFRAVWRDQRKIQNKIIPRTQARALKATGRRVTTRSVRELAARVGVKQKLLRSRFRFAIGATGRRVRAAMVVLIWHVPAIKLGNVRQKRGAVTAGRHRWPGAWLGTLKYGEGVFKSTAGDIDSQGVPIAAAVDAIVPRQLNGEGARFYVRELERLLARALNR